MHSAPADRKAGLAVAMRAFWLPKAGHDAAEYEDAFALPEHAVLPLRAAVADGATESIFAQVWAELLVQGFVTDDTAAPDALEDRLRDWRASWQAGTASRTQALPWYAAAKAEQGAYAAFLGFVLKPDRDWQAVAVGDCCLFHLRGGAVLLRWPVGSPGAFHNRPALLGSRPGPPVPELQVQAGTWQPGDVFLLATDAFSAWLMQTDAAPARILTQEAFARQVAAARAAGAMRNDDVTLVTLEVDAEG